MKLSERFNVTSCNKETIHPVHYVKWMWYNPVYDLWCYTSGGALESGSASKI